MSKQVKRNTYLTYGHKHSFGSALSGAAGGLNMESLGKGIRGSIGAIGSAVGGTVGGLIGGGYQSGAGDAFNQIGNIGSAIPGPWGAIIGGGAKVLGGLTNAAFGTKVDQEKLSAANMGTSTLNSFKSNASSFDDVKGIQAVANVQDAYKGGWFAKGSARRKNEELRRQRAEAMSFADRSVENNIENLADEQMDTMLANYAAFGGPLHTNGADWNTGITVVDNGGSHESNPLEGVPMGMAPDGTPNLVEEGEVIFNDYVFSKRLRVPKAVREKYKLRGAKDLTFADAAKKAQKESEERPNDPISKRGLEAAMKGLMYEQEQVRQKKEERRAKQAVFAYGGSIHIDPSKKGTFTAAASKHGMGVQEFASKVLANPDDYSPAMRKKANFAKNASKWHHADGGLLNYFACGGHKHGDGDFLYRNYGTPMYFPNEDSTNYGLFGNNYLPDTPITLEPLRQIARDKTIQRGDGSKVRAAGNNTNFTLVPTGKSDTIPMLNLERAQGVPVYKETPITLNEKIDLPNIPITSNTYSEESKKGWKWDESQLRYVPAIGAGLSVMSDLFGWTNKPDYSGADAIMNAAGDVANVRFNPIGDYLGYRPFDRLFYANQLGAQAGATRRNIMNTSGGNRGVAMAGLLSADYNTGNQLGNLYRQAEEYNLGQRQKVAEFNRATNEFNSEGFLKAAMANQQGYDTKVKAAIAAAELRDKIDSRVGAARSANLTNFFNSIGDIGREAYSRNMIETNPALYYSIDRNGRITYKKGFDKLSEEEKQTVRDYVNYDKYKAFSLMVPSKGISLATIPEPTQGPITIKKKSKGGYLTIRRKK